MLLHKDREQFEAFYSADVHFTHIKFALNRLFANCFGCGMMLLLM